MKSYLIKLALKNVTPMVWRRIWISGTTSLAELHNIIQLSFGLDNEHLHLFHIYGKDYGISYLGGMSFDDNPNKVFFDDFRFDVKDKFYYEYNFFVHCIVDIRIEKIEDTEEQGLLYCAKGNGMPGIIENEVLDTC